MMLRALLTSLVCGCTGLRDSQRLHHNLSRTARGLFAPTKPISDTALRHFLIKLHPHALRPLLRHVVRQAHASKTLGNDVFPYGVVALDGKQTHTPIHDHTLTQRRKGKAYLRTITCCLTSSKLKPCVDCVPLMPHQNEESAFPGVFDDLCKHFGRWFQLVTYDAGACSKDNAALVDRAKRGYVFALKKNQPTLFEEAKQLLAPLPPQSCQAQESDYAGGKVVTRRVWVRRVSGAPWWSHIRAVFRVQTTSEDKTTHTVTREDRYFISNIPLAGCSSESAVGKGLGQRHVLSTGLTERQWLRLTRLHWGVENNCHCLWDKQMHEDRKRWIFEPQGMLSVQMLRRVASLFLALYRATSRCARTRGLSWPALMELFLYMAWTLARVPKRPWARRRLDSS